MPYYTVQTSRYRGVSRSAYNPDDACRVGPGPPRSPGSLAGGARAGAPCGWLAALAPFAAGEPVTVPAFAAGLALLPPHRDAMLAAPALALTGWGLAGGWLRLRGFLRIAGQQALQPVGQAVLVGITQRPLYLTTGNGQADVHAGGGFGQRGSHKFHNLW